MNLRSSILVMVWYFSCCAKLALKANYYQWDTRIVENRAKKLKIDYLRQSKRDGCKVAAVQDIMEAIVALEK